jgi:NTE family protein
MSSTVYQALRSAGYPDAGIIAFATSLLAELCEEKRASAGKEPPVDTQTGFPTGPALVEIIEFEIDRARSMRPRPALLGIIVVTVHTRELCTARERFADENAIVEALRSRRRFSDTAGRTDDREFVLILPGAGEHVVASLALDIHRALSRANFSRGSRPEVRHASLEGRTDGAAELLDLARRSMAVCEVVEPARRHAQQLLQGPVALALCGGAAMAAAHVGVIAGLEDLGAKITGIGATSAGALVAAMYAAGMDRAAMLDRFLTLSTSPVYAEIRNAYAATRIRDRKDRRGMSRSRLGFASMDELAVAGDDVLRALVEHFVPRDRPIESMRIRLAFSATDLVSGGTTYISHGSLHDGLMAACAVPGLFPPQKLGSKLLVDGSLAGELPVAAAMSIAGTAGVIGCYLEGPEAPMTTFDNGMAVAARVAAIRQRELVCEQTRACEAVLRVPVKDVGWMGFSRCADAERAGRETVQRELGLSIEIETAPTAEASAEAAVDDPEPVQIVPIVQCG